MSDNYRARNWAQYNRALVKRGSLTLWFDEKSVEEWYEACQSGERGRSKLYSDLAVRVSATLRAIFRLPFRATQGFLNSLFTLLKLPLKSLSYTQLCRRLQIMPVKLEYQINKPVHMVVDSTGLKLYGEGEWKTKIHGQSKHRMWRKLHLGVDEATNEIIACELTTNHIGDNKVLDPLLGSYQGQIKRVSADKGYDGHEAFDTIVRYGADPVILTQRTAKVSRRKTKSARDLVIQEIAEIGRDEWKKRHRYHRRSLCETAMFRYKTIFGAQLNSRNLESQKREALLKCNLLNKFNSFCKLDSYKTGFRA